METEALWWFISGVMVGSAIVSIIFNIVVDRNQKRRIIDFINSPLEDNNERIANKEEHHTGESQDKSAGGI